MKWKRFTGRSYESAVEKADVWRHANAENIERIEMSTCLEIETNRWDMIIFYFPKKIGEQPF